MNINVITQSLWIEKYRPQTLDEIALSQEARELINKYVKEDTIPNLFLCSRPGQGKTSLARLLAYNVFDCDTLYINASDENGVDTVRTKIADFSRTMSTNGKFKIVILDEMDGFANTQSQKMLRGLMEEVSDNTRFIITANQKNRVIDAIQSRCQFIDITPPINEITARLLYIIKKEGVKLNAEDGPKLGAMIKRFYPDMRSIIKNLQASVFDGVLKMKDYKVESEFMYKLFELMQGGDPIAVRTHVITNELSFSSDYSMLLDDLYHLIIDSDKLNGMQKSKWTITIANYLAKMPNVIDAELNASACLFELMS